ncbi:MAG TPA: restriction endonuclease subunit S [Opitutus sp.]|nr:restriction endonuclease subunit S [Opitutus sp.]
MTAATPTVAVKPNEWLRGALSSVCTTITKGTTPKDFVESDADSVVNYIKSESLNYDGTIDETAFAKIDAATHEALKRSQLAENDILISIAGAKLGKCGSVQRKHLPANTNQAVAIVRVDPRKAHWRFVEYCLRQRTLTQAINSGVAQSAQPNLNLTDLGRIEFALPPLVEQRAIAAVLGALDDKIEANRRINATLEAMARALFKSWFVDFDPVRAKMEGRDLAMAPDIVALFPDAMVEGVRGLTPAGWDMRALRDFVSLQRGTTYQSALLDDEGPFLLGLASIAPDGGFRSTSLRTYGGDCPEKMLLRPGDIYVSLKDVTQSGDLLGAVARVPKSIPVGRLTQDTLKLIFDRNAIEPTYVYWALRQPQYRAYCRARSMGTTNLSLSREDFLGYELPIPSEAEQRIVARALDAFDSRVELNLQINATLALTRDLLLPRLLSGALRVRDAQCMVGDAA